MERTVSNNRSTTTRSVQISRRWSTTRYDCKWKLAETVSRTIKLETDDHNLIIKTPRKISSRQNFDKMSERIRRALQMIKKNQSNAKTSVKLKKAWYRVGKAIHRGQKFKFHPEKKLAHRRMYKYYKIGKGDWEGPSPRNFAKMSSTRFERVLKRREQLKRGTLLETEDVTVNTAETMDAENRRESHEQGHVMEISEDIAAPQGNEFPRQSEALELVDLQGLDLQDTTVEEFLLTW